MVLLASVLGSFHHLSRCGKSFRLVGLSEMPLAIYTCPCGHDIESLHPVGKRPPVLTCKCGLTAVVNVAKTYRPAKTAGKWGDSTGHYDVGLGRYVNNSGERDQLLAAKGLVAESDMPSGYFDSQVQASLDDSEQHERTMARYRANLETYGDKGIALAETFPAHEILDNE